MERFESRDVAQEPGDDGDASSLEGLLPRRKLVVVIGIDAYTHLPKLHRAVNDALGVQMLLVDRFGFDVPIEPLIDAAATKPAIEALVDDRLRALLEPDDALVLFFAGHGTTRVDRLDAVVEESGYLAPVEARGGSQFSDMINVEDLLKRIGRLKARHILVVLDACHSGMALGSTITQFRSPASFVSDLGKQRSRRVITSARGDQPALDNGPVEGHSLFTGTLIDGLNWGKADLDGNGIVSSSELGLFLQQQVGQASHSRQTPDFGAFHLDDRGELLIALGEGSFENVKARAYAALQQGEHRRFAELVARASALRPGAPEVLYLKLRLALIEGALEWATSCASGLLSRHLPEGRIPLVPHEIEALMIQLDYWAELMSPRPTEIPLEVQVLSGPDQSSLRPAPLERIGDLEGYRLRLGHTFALQLRNPTDAAAHVYLVELDPAGRFGVLRLWRDNRLLFRGLAPGASEVSLPFRPMGEPGVYELRLYASPRFAGELMSPPAVRSRCLLPRLEIPPDMQVCKLYLKSEVSRDGGREDEPRRPNEPTGHPPFLGTT